MLTTKDIQYIWPGPENKDWRRVVLLAQELVPIHTACSGCDHSANMEMSRHMPRRDCCVYDKARVILDSLNALEELDK
jgi:hypothetical protein